MIAVSDSGKRNRPAGDRAASNVTHDGNGTMISRTVDYLDAAQRRVLVDLLLGGWGATWERRARALESARPRPGDFHGRANHEDLRAQYRRLTEAAQACRARAQVSPLELAEDAVDAVREEMSADV